ncbi:MAG: ferrous iron transport protein B [Pirellulales bacterium]
MNENDKSLRVALLGNPNTGKSSLFNALVGGQQQVGNYPGATVEKFVGRCAHEGRELAITDLPGLYSLNPASPDEQIAVDILLTPNVADMQVMDVVVCVLDASNLVRNLYLTTQVLELGIPAVVALNMMDVAAQAETTIDVEQLSAALGVPVVVTHGSRKQGIDELRSAIASATVVATTKVTFSDPVEAAIASATAATADQAVACHRRCFLNELALSTDVELCGDEQVESKQTTNFSAALDLCKQQFDAAGDRISMEPIARYAWINQVVSSVVECRDTEHSLVRRRWLDRVLIHPFSGSLIFLATLTLLFQAVFSWSGPAMDLIGALFAWLGSGVESLIAEGMLRSLIVDGLIAGIGGVVIFLPQILILFFFIGLMEDFGYMARAAYLMDNVMSKVGLSGKSFIPLLSSFACAIPGIMAARSIKNRNDRLATMLIAPLMSCSARLPVYILITAACIPERQVFGGWISQQALVLVSMYLLGIVVAICVAWILKKTILKGETPVFVMELPSFKMPSISIVSRKMFQQGMDFVKQAGTLILACTVLIWALAYFPRSEETVELSATQTSGIQLRNSYLGRAGQAIEPVVRPLGWDWKIGIAVLASFPAREVVVGTMGVIYNLGDEEDEASEGLRDHLKNARWDHDPTKPVFTVPVGLSIMVFFALCAQCVSTLAVLKKETQSWRWPLFTFVYMTVLAYVAAWVTFVVASNSLTV